MTAPSGSEPKLAGLLRSPLAVLALAALLLGAAYFAGGYWTSLAARTAVLALGAVSLSFLIGQAGLVSFGHAAPIGVGAYAALVLGESGISEVLVVLPAAFAAAGLFALLTGLVALRTRGVYFIMITLAFAQMVYYVATSLSLYGGDDGMTLAARVTFLGHRFVRSDAGLALLAGGLVAAAVLVLEWLRGTGFGMVLRAARQNEARVAALGLAPFGYRLVGYALASGIAGISGALLANQADFVAPAYMNWHRSGELIVMVALGGIARPSGAVLGAIVVIAIEEAIGHYTEFWKLGLGLVIVGTVLVRAGLLGRLIRGGAHG